MCVKNFSQTKSHFLILYILKCNKIHSTINKSKVSRAKSHIDISGPFRTSASGRKSWRIEPRVWLARRSGIGGKGKECRSREGELNADCESLSSDLTNFTILERAVTCCASVRGRRRERRKGERQKSREWIRLRTMEGREEWGGGAAPLKLRMHSRNCGGGS